MKDILGLNNIDLNQYVNSFTNFTEIALWTYKVENEFYIGDDISDFLNAIYSSNLVFTNDYFVKFKNLEKLEDVIGKSFKELGIFPKIKIDKFLSETYFNNFKIKKYPLEGIINENLLSIECDLNCMFNEDNKLIIIMGSFIDRTQDLKNRQEVENLNKILVEQNSFYSRKIQELEQEKSKVDIEQEMYKGLFFESPTAKFIIHPLNFAILQINNIALNLFGVSYDKKLQLLDLVDATNYEELVEYLRQHNGKQSTVFKGFTKTTQKELYIEIKSVRVKYDGHDAILVHLTDLSEQINFYEKEFKLQEKINLMRNTLIDTQTSYKNFIDESPYGVIIVQNEEIKYVNKISLEQLGAKFEEELIGKNIYKFIDSSYHEFVIQKFERVLSERLHTEALKEKLIRLNGEKFFSEIITFPTQFDGNDAVQILFTDITEKIYQQQVLLESEERYRSIFESSFDAILITDYDGKITDNNSASLKLFKYDRHNIINKNIKNFLVSDTYSFIEDPFTKILNEENFEGRCFARDKNKREFIVGVSFGRIQLNGKERIYISVKDISTEILAVNKINESRKEAIDIIDNMTIPVSISDYESGEIFYYSHKFYEVFGKNIVSSDFSTFSLYKDENDAKYLRKLLNDNKKLKNFEVELVDKDGKIVVALLSSSRLKFREKDAILSVILDITERKKYEEDLKDKDRLLEEMSFISRTGGWEYNIESEELKWSAETYKIHNVEFGSELIADFALSFYHPDDKNLIIDCFTNLIQYSISYDIELRIKPLNKDYIWVRTIGHTINSGGKVNRVFGTIQDINEKKLREIKLKEYAETLILASRAANFGVFDWNINQNKLTWDDNMWELFELEKQEIINIQFWQNCVADDDKLRISNEFISALKNKRDFEFEFRILNQNNETKYIQTYAYVEFDTDKTKRMVGVCWDITKEKIQEIQINEALEKYETLYNNSPVMMHSIDSQGRILSVSDYWLKKLGYSREEVIGRKSTDFHTEKSKKYAEEVVLPQYYKTGITNSAVYEIVKKNKNIITVELSATTETDENGNYIRSLAVMVDITDKIRAEKESEHKTNRLIEFRKALDVSAYVMFVNIDGKIKYANDNFQRLVELNAAKLHNLQIDKLFDLNESNFEINDFINKLKKGETWQGDIKLSNSLETWLKLTAIPLYDTNTENSEVLIISFDITKIIEAEKSMKNINRNLEIRVNERTKDLIALNKEKDNILSMVSHDLKNPITGIILATDIIKMQADKYKDDKLKEISEKISKTSYKMIDIIKNLLELNAVESGKIQTQFAYVDLTIVLNNVVSDAQLNANAKQQTINLINNFEQYPAYIDRKLLTQILDNLVSNAIKFTHKGKNIFIELIDDENYYTIVVQDEGVGISKEDIPNMFHKFSKLSSKPTDGEDSTGLGLSIVKQLVEIMNGTISVESEVGVGTKFFVRFNRHQANF